MLKLAGLDGLFAAAGNLYLLLMLAGILFALWKGKTWARKLGFAAPTSCGSARYPTTW